MNKVNIEIPKASYFDYSYIINEYNISNAITIIDKLIANNRYKTDKPTFQTFDNLFEIDEFLKFKNTFLNSCQQILNLNSFKYQIFGFAYVDFYDNYILKNRDDQWHQHEDSDLVGVMYLKNDEYKIHPNSGTEFAITGEISNGRPRSLGYIDPVPYSWHIFSGSTFHRPGLITTNNKRYVLTGLIKILD